MRFYACNFSAFWLGFFIFWTEKYIHIGFLALSKIIIRLAQAKFVNWLKIVETSADFNDIAIA